MRAGAGAQVEGGNLGVQAVGEARVPYSKLLFLPSTYTLIGTFSSFSHEKEKKMLFLDTFYE